MCSGVSATPKALLQFGAFLPRGVSIELHGNANDVKQPAVTIKHVEVSIVDQGFAAGLIQPVVPDRITGHTVAIIGSGPAGLAAAQQLTRAGHTVVVYEREGRLGGLLRYGLSDFKLGKHHIVRLLEQLRTEGTRFETSVEIGRDFSLAELRSSFDAVIVGRTIWCPRVVSRQGSGRSAPTPTANTSSSSVAATPARAVWVRPCDRPLHRSPPWRSETKHQRSETAFWPMLPRIFELQSCHEGVRVIGIDVAATQFIDGRRVPTPGIEHRPDADLVLLAGDAGRGQSLIVWAIAAGRSVAAAVDRFPTGSSRLPESVNPHDTAFKC